MRARFWGTRGSLPVPRPTHATYGGNTSCVQVMVDDDRHVVVLDAGTGVTALGESIGPEVERVDVLLSHLHMDHILGLGFFEPLFTPGLEVHLWGPASTTLDLHDRLTRYLSPPLFPVVLRDLPCDLRLHDTPMELFDLSDLSVRAELVCHPGPTVGYRLDDGRTTMAYLSDHEPALLAADFPGRPEWTSGYDLAEGVDLLVHDAQYLDDQYADRLGWGHSAISDTLAFANLCGVGHLVAFHHDPAHDDATLDRIYADLAGADLAFDLTAAKEGEEIAVSTAERRDLSSRGAAGGR